MRLYHFSEEPGIAVFAPRTPLARPEVEPLVWAIDAWHAPHYLLPRDCPRACFWAVGGTSAADRGRFLRGGERVIAIERGWLAAVRAATLYRYEFDAAAFDLVDETAGYYVSRQTLRPLAVGIVQDLPAAIEAAGIELRPVEGLYRLHLEVVGSTLQFSRMRLRNAQDFMAEAAT